jgi:hypothetical protein
MKMAAAASVNASNGVDGNRANYAQCSDATGACSATTAWPRHQARMCVCPCCCICIIIHSKGRILVRACVRVNHAQQHAACMQHVAALRAQRCHCQPAPLIGSCIKSGVWHSLLQRPAESGLCDAGVQAAGGMWTLARATTCRALIPSPSMAPAAIMPTSTVTRCVQL